MNDDRLDGNAAAGLLGEVFPFEMTMASTVCAGCGALDHMGALLVYERAPGAVIRCAHCEGVQMRIASDAGRYWLDLRGVSCVEIRV